MPPDDPKGRGLAAPEVLPPPTLIGLPPTSELIETPEEGEGRVEEEKKNGGRGSVVLLPESATKDNIISEAASLEELHSIVISIYCNGVIRTNDGWIF